MEVEAERTLHMNDNTRARPVRPNINTSARMRAGDETPPDTAGCGETPRRVHDLPDKLIVVRLPHFTGEVGIACAFSRGWFPQVYDKLLVAATGIDKIGERGYLQRVGERIVNLERAFIVREGFGRKQDTLPQRMLSEPLHTRGAPGEGQMMRNLDKFLDRYYEIRGWTPEGIPSPEKLKELGLGYVVKDMAQYQKVKTI